MAEKRVLVVDDEQAIRDVYRQIFEQAGYTVRTAASAEEAVEIMQQTPFWVLFLDLELPGMNGLDLCRQIRQKWHMAIPYAVTGYASLFQLSDCREAGFEDYFTKPARPEDLLQAADYAFNKLSRWVAAIG